MQLLAAPFPPTFYLRKRLTAKVALALESWSFDGGFGRLLGKDDRSVTLTDDLADWTGWSLFGRLPTCTAATCRNKAEQRQLHGSSGFVGSPTLGNEDDTEQIIPLQVDRSIDYAIRCTQLAHISICLMSPSTRSSPQW